MWSNRETDTMENNFDLRKVVKLGPKKPEEYVTIYNTFEVYVNPTKQLLAVCHANGCLRLDIDRVRQVIYELKPGIVLVNTEDDDVLCFNNNRWLCIRGNGMCYIESKGRVNFMLCHVLHLKQVLQSIISAFETSFGNTLSKTSIQLYRFTKRTELCERLPKANAGIPDGDLLFLNTVQTQLEHRRRNHGTVYDDDWFFQRTEEVNDDWFFQRTKEVNDDWFFQHTNIPSLSSSAKKQQKPSMLSMPPLGSSDAWYFQFTNMPNGGGDNNKENNKIKVATVSSECLQCRNRQALGMNSK